jgi:hypothetical protein
MTPAGWLIMAVSVGTVTALLTWCIYKVLTVPHETERVHGFEHETPDIERPEPD